MDVAPNIEVSQNIRRKEFELSLDTPDVLENLHVGILLKKVYTPTWPGGIDVKYTIAKANDSYKLTFSIPEKTRYGMYWMTVANPQNRVKAYIKVPVSMVPQTEDPLQWVFKQKWFKALKFTLHTQWAMVEHTVHLYNLKKQVELMLSEILAQQEALELQQVTNDVVNVIYGLRGLKVVELHFLGERDPGLYILKGVYDIPVNMRKYKKIDFNIHLEYAVGISTNMIPYDSEDNLILEEHSNYIPLLHGGESITEYEPIPDYHLEVIKTVFLKKLHGL